MSDTAPEQQWTSVAALRKLWLDRSGPQSEEADPRIEGAFNAVTEDLVDAISAAADERLVAGHQSLRRLYSAVVARAKDTTNSLLETEPAFGVGRLVGLLDIASDAIRRVSVGAVEAELGGLFNEPFSMQVLEALNRKDGALVKSQDLLAELQREGKADKGSLSRKLTVLEERGLVSTRRLGTARLSTLTPLGTEVLRRHLDAKPKPVDFLGDVRNYRRSHSRLARVS